jgi:3-(3-hydroxy-phenyl)propionate hydroxylase
MFDQPDLEGLLRKRMSELDLITFRPNVEVTGVRPHGGTGPAVEYIDFETGDTHVVEAGFVFGCDGANSIVRRSIGSTMRDLGFPEQRWLVVDITTPRQLGHWAGVHQVCSSQRAATYMQIGQDRHRWEFELLDGESAAAFQTLDALAPLLSPWDADLHDFEIGRVAEYTFRAQIADRWRQGRVFLLGDAAHLTPPFIGQGMGAGLRDAANLSWKVAAVIRGTLPAATLNSYETERVPHARSMVKLAVLVGRLMTGGGRLGDRLRPILIPNLVHLPHLRRRVLNSATPALSRSALVHRPVFGRRLAGTLCPNVDLQGVRFDQAVGRRYALVVRGNAAGSCAPRLDALNAAIVASEANADLNRWLGNSEAALIRPDRTVQVAGKAHVVLRQLSLLVAAANRQEEVPA